MFPTVTNFFFFYEPLCVSFQIYFLSKYIKNNVKPNNLSTPPITRKNVPVGYSWHILEEY